MPGREIELGLNHWSPTCLNTPDCQLIYGLTALPAALVVLYSNRSGVPYQPTPLPWKLLWPLSKAPPAQRFFFGRPGGGGAVVQLIVGLPMFTGAPLV